MTLLPLLGLTFNKTRKIKNTQVMVRGFISLCFKSRFEGIHLYIDFEGRLGSLWCKNFKKL
ncbi:hypothetical protein Hanom_Chr04g00291141 [Helianthus anomalus]